MLKLKYMKNKKSQRGFIRFIVLIIIVLVIGQLLGYGPVEFFNKVIIPIVEILWKVILLIVHLIVKAIQEASNIVSRVPVSDIMKSFNK